MVAILVVLTFITCILIDSIVQRAQAKKTAVSVTPMNLLEVKDALPLTAVGIDLKNHPFQIPSGLFFHQGHTWLGLHRSGLARVGVDDFAQCILGRFDALKTRRVGEKVKQGEPLFAIKQGKRLAKFASPADGVIVAINENALNQPDVIKQHPYTEGWIYTINPTNLASSLQRLTVGQSALSWLQKEVNRFQAFVNRQFPQDALVGQTLQDGGLVVDGPLAHMGDETWYHFEAEFLQGSNELNPEWER